VLDPQAELAAFAAREEPVEERGADVADVQQAGRARRHADADGHAQRLSRVPLRSATIQRNASDGGTGRAGAASWAASQATPLAYCRGRAGPDPARAEPGDPRAAASPETRTASGGLGARTRGRTAIAAGR